MKIRWKPVVKSVSTGFFQNVGHPLGVDHYQPMVR
jgi:hypothetical protein